MPLTRRRFAALALTGLAVPLAAPALLRAQSAAEEVAAESRAMDQLHTIMVQRGGDLVVAEAPRDRGLNQVANIKSCSKSLLALLLGTALARGEIASLDATLGDVAHRLIPDDATEGVRDLTMRDLVTLRMGLQGTSGADYGAWVNSPDWVGYVLRQPRIAENGGQMIYSTGTTHVLGAALTEATGTSLRDLARARLGDPLGIDIPDWLTDPQGYYFGGNEMGLTPRAMLRVAVAMRDGGRWGGEQVIPGDWVTASRLPRTRSPYSGLDHGYGWFLTEDGWVLARGYGGQIIAALPRSGLAVAITSDPTRPARSDGYFGALLALLRGPVAALA